MEIKPFKKAYSDENERRTIYQQELFEKQKSGVTVPLITSTLEGFT